MVAEKLNDTEVPAPGPAPHALVDPQGRVRYGVYNSPFERVSLNDARWTTALGVNAPRALRKMRLKRWQHFCLVHPEALVTCAVVDAAYLKTSWVQFVDLNGGLRLEHHQQAPRADVAISDALFDGTTHFRRRRYELSVRNHLDAGRHTLRIDIGQDARRGLPAISGELRALHPMGQDRIEPLVVALPLHNQRAMYSHKVALPVEGRLSIGRRCLLFDPSECFAILDIHAAHYPHHTWWKWATFATKVGKHRVALNLTRNVVVGEELNENAIWLDGKLQRLDTALFERVGQRWRVGSRDSRVDLTFTPLGARTENLNLGVVRSRFEQFYGRFHGSLRHGDEVVDIDGAVGLFEDHDSKW